MVEFLLKAINLVLGYMIVNVDTCAAVFHPDGSLLDYVAKILGKRNVEELRRGISDSERRNLERVTIFNNN